MKSTFVKLYAEDPSFTFLKFIMLKHLYYLCCIFNNNFNFVCYSEPFSLWIRKNVKAGTGVNLYHSISEDKLKYQEETNFH